MKRRVVHKITPVRQSSFDQQFWPVLVALTVLSGIALGAILTILDGPWMWGSLLLLPVLAVTSIFLLFRLDNATLRRSLQFAIILSLALHLFVLVFASVVNIFQNPFKPSERQVAQQRPVRTIEVSDRRASFVWEETNSRDTPEPNVEPEKQTEPTSNVQPQPIPVPETKPEVNPQLTKRESTSESVPRQNRTLSQLKRQTQNLQPRSSQQVTGNRQSATQLATSTAQPKPEATSSEQANAVARQSAPAPESQPDPAQSAPAAASKPKQEIARTSSSPRRSDPAKPPTVSAPLASTSTARVRRSTPNLPVASNPAPAVEKIAAATTRTSTESQPIKSASQTTRRPEQSTTTSPALTNQPRTELSPRPQVARSSQRRRTEPTQPTISNNAAAARPPRRSTRESQLAASPLAIENPTRAPQSETASRDLNSKTLSVSRSSEGVAGVGRSNNLDRFAGGMTSPASRASDSARRERTQSTPSEVRMLSSSERSETRRSIGSNARPSSTFKADTSSAAKIAGSKNPGERSLEASAASVESASTVHRDEISAEKGNAAVDLGPTKVVMDRPSQRRSGGGQPEVSQLNPESTRASQDRSEQQPSLLAATGLDVVAPSNPSSAAPASDALEASEQSAVATRSGGESEITAQRRSAEVAGDTADQGQTDLARALADSRARARQFQDESGWDSQEDETDEENPGGIRRTRIAQAPVVRSDPGTGLASNDGLAVNQAEQAGDAPTESLATNISRQANAAVPGTGIGRSAANVLIQAATSLPVVEASTSRRTGSASSTDSDAELKSALANRPRSRAVTSNAPQPSASAFKSSDANLAIQATGVDSSKTDELNSTAVTIAKTATAAMVQIQGSKLEVIAEEGPAGLGLRPDEFIGIMSRPSSRDSEQIQPDMNTRFRSPRFGGTPAVNPDAVIARDAFRSRSPAAMSTAAEPTTEAAIHLGLEFLARNQSPGGSWSLTGFDRDAPQHRAQLDSDTAATGLALLAFQGAGYNHREFKYARQIDSAIQWLIENQADDGGLYVPTDQRSNGACRLYSHGIAALALTEAYGMTQDARLKEPAQKALDYIASSQDPRKGGWRYFADPAKKSTDTSVSGWMMMALQSGRLAGLNVDSETFDSIENWLDVAADPDDISRYRYNPYAEDSKGVSRERQGRTPTPSMTAVGLLMRIYSGWERDDPRLLAGADFLLDQQLPSDSAPLLRDTYYWYYATQVLKHIDGPRWEKWNDRLRPLLTRSQEKTGELAGSWHPYRPIPDRWGQFGGRIYVTTMNLLSLEVRHRMLPLYKQGESPNVGARIDSIPRRVSTSWKPERDIDSSIVTTVRRPAVGPGTTRVPRPTSARRPLSLGMNGPPTVAQSVAPQLSGSGDPIIQAAVRPPEQSANSDRRHSVEPSARNVVHDPIPTPRSQRVERVDVEVIAGEIRSAAPQTLLTRAPATTGRDVDVNSPQPDLPQTVAFKPNLQPRLSEPVSLSIETSPSWINLPELAAPGLPSEYESSVGETSVGETSLIEPALEIATKKSGAVSTANDFSRTTEFAIPTSSPEPLQSIIDRTSKTNRLELTEARIEPTQSIVLRPDSRNLMPMMPQLAQKNLATEPTMPVGDRLPRLEPPAQPADYELPITQPMISEPVNLLMTVKPDLEPKANVESKPFLSEAPLSSSKPLLSTRDRLSRADGSNPGPSSPELDRTIDNNPTTVTSRSSLPLSPVAPEPDTAGLETFPVLESNIEKIESEHQISNIELANPVARRSTGNSPVAEPVSGFSRTAIGEPNLDTLVRDRFRIKDFLQSRLANPIRNEATDPTRFDREGILPTQSNRRRLALMPIRTVLPRLIRSRTAPPNASGPQQGMNFVSASGVVTLDGEVLPGATIELIPIDVPDGTPLRARTNESGQFILSAQNARASSGLRAGKYKVAITTFVESPDEDVIDFLEVVPEKYNSDTKLVISVSPKGPNAFELKLVTD